MDQTNKYFISMNTNLQHLHKQYAMCFLLLSYVLLLYYLLILQLNLATILLVNNHHHLPHQMVSLQYHTQQLNLQGHPHHNNHLNLHHHLNLVFHLHSLTALPTPHLSITKPHPQYP